MYRRHTTGGESWSVCQYYYTHNNGSSDDILLSYKPLKISNFKRRNSCPTELPQQRQQQQQQQQQQSGEKEQLEIEEIKQDFSLNRKSTLKSKKRETLANILSNISRKDEDNLDKKWQSMDLKMSSLRTNTTLCEMNDTVIDIESIESDGSIRSINAPLQPSSTTPISGAIRVEDEQVEVEDYDKLDMWFFLFGFLCFPLWWISAWRYFTHPKSKNRKKKNPKMKIFQTVNLWMTMGSLMLLGLMIGLAVTFST